VKNVGGGRLMPDGTLHFPVRGKPPRPIQGYVRDPANPYAFFPIAKPCVHRNMKETFFQDCGCTGTMILCTLYKSINMSRCYQCTERKEPDATNQGIQQEVSQQEHPNTPQGGSVS
jgi:hypothetical protein